MPHRQVIVPAVTVADWNDVLGWSLPQAWAVRSEAITPEVQIDLSLPARAVPDPLGAARLRNPEGVWRLLERAPEFLVVLAEGLRWTREHLRDLAEPEIELALDPEDGGEVLRVSFERRSCERSVGQLRQAIREAWSMRAWKLAPIELRVMVR